MQIDKIQRTQKKPFSKISVFSQQHWKHPFQPQLARFIFHFESFSIDALQEKTHKQFKLQDFLLLLMKPVCLHKKKTVIF